LLLFWWQKSNQKNQRQKRRFCLFCFILLRKKRKTVVRCAEVEIFTKSQSASLALLVRSAAPTYAGFWRRTAKI